MNDSVEKTNNVSRRNFLLAGTALTVAAGSGVGLTSAPAQAAIKSSARIVIVGSGLAGLGMVNRLRRQLDGAKITLLDAKKVHHYQPGFTLVATGIWPVDKVSDTNKELIPAGVEWVQEMAHEFKPDTNQVITDSGRVLDYDYLVVATGLHLDFDQIEGMDVGRIGSNGLASVYPSPDHALASWKAMEKFCKTGGRALMTLPNTAIKCAGAPLKMTFMLANRAQQAGTLAKSSIDFHSAITSVFSVPVINQEVLNRWDTIGIPVHFQSKLVAVDIDGQRATFEKADGSRVVEDYDFLHVAPAMCAPDSVRKSPLAWQEGPQAQGGWLDVDPGTLQHNRYKNVFGVGDINGTAKGKTAATVKKSVPLVVENLLSVMAGEEPKKIFDGYTSCPLLVREGAALLVEFDYQNNLTPTVPFVKPLEESYFAWLLKYRLFKPSYIAVAKGHL
ncbi:NAD(P)/FAD-dependent oxidoreductase [Pseudomonas sp. C27(2019)]|uniref:NAD(P)/FAD-dependent oxidoreductase n=1 Tax=Pseudomonas sp. C27(2019) TaxID=2604941 RepID=UPI001248C556|nr:FAD/NAD(P)-binding oxidoreductase [Pseudomonas sp. C27(2019)]QEY58768.1 NAD(P)/FAD-dependent oxidoreductase [Pseudomonas sp. C27(2019)]